MPRLIRVAAMAAGLVACVPLHYLWKLAGARSIWPQVYLAYAGRCAGLRVHIDGQPLTDQVLFVANHVSWLDILALGGATRAVFVSRDDVAGWPLVGWIAALNDTLYVARQARREVQVQADQIRQTLRLGRAVALFPEGTTDHLTMKFRPSLFASLFPPLAGVRVQPVVIDYGPLAREIAWMGDEPAGANAGRILARKGHIPVRLNFLEPIDPARAGDRKQVAAQAQFEVAQSLAGRAASDAGSDPLYAPR